MSLLIMMATCLNAQDSIRENGIENSKRIKILLQLTHRNMDANVPMAEYQANSALHLAEAIQDLSGAALASSYLANIYGSKILDFKKGIFYYKKSLLIAGDLNDAELLAKNHFSVAALYYELGFYGKALDHLSACLSIYKDRHDRLSESFVLISMAAIYSESSGESFSKMRVSFEDALNVSEAMKSDSLFIATTSYYTTALIANDQFEDVDKYLNKALIIAKANDHYAKFTQILYLNLGDVFFHEGLFNAAINRYEMSRSICERFKFKSELPSISLGLGKAYFELGEIALAKKNFLNALESFEYLGMKGKLMEVYNELSLIESKQKDYESAFKYKSLQLALKDSLFADQFNLLYDVQSRLSMDRMAIQHRDRNINWLSTNLIFFIIMGGCFFGLVYLNYKRLFVTKIRSDLEKERIILEKELQNTRFEEEKLNQQLEFNAKSLTANTLHMIQKNEILLQIKEKVEEMRASSIETDRAIKSKELANLVNFGLNIDKDWENFKIHFKQIHTGFFDELKSKYPHLNSSDLKLCALIKLNLDTKEIAAIMNISPQSAKVARSRLRKKLELDLTSNLSAFITQIHS